MTRPAAHRLRGFYAVLDRDDLGLAEALAAAAPCAIQLRLKGATTAELCAAARRAAPVARAAGALFIVNDRLDVALAAGADGAHLGQSDLPLAEARRIAERARPESPPLLGVSTHNGPELADALAGGADYVGFGPVFPTATKENPDPTQGLESLRRAAAEAGSTPVVAIGGVTPERASAIASAGASAACAIAAVNRSGDLAPAGRRIAAAWPPPRGRARSSRSTSPTTGRP